MSSSDSTLTGTPGGSAQFTTTHWSVVLTAGRETSPAAQRALEKLCRTYWYPLYAYVRRQGHSEPDAQDLTQEFFARLLEKNFLDHADPERGRFRSFLLTSLKNFLHNEWKKARRDKRGGRQAFISWDAQTAEERYKSEPSDQLTPEKLFEKRWAVTLLEQVLASLREEFQANGRVEVFDRLKVFIWGEQEVTGYAAVAAQLGMTESAIKVTVHRLRRRYRELLRAEIANTVSSPSEVDEELRHLAAVIRGE